MTGSRGRGVPEAEGPQGVLGEEESQRKEGGRREGSSRGECPGGEVPGAGGGPGTGESQGEEEFGGTGVPRGGGLGQLGKRLPGSC